MYYAKAVVAALGAGVTAASALVPSNTGWGIGLAVASASLTVLGTYLVPNKPQVK